MAYSLPKADGHEPSGCCRPSNSSRTAGYQRLQRSPPALPHGLHGVVLAVFVIRLAACARLAGQELHQVVEPLVDLRVLVDAGAVEGHHGGGRAGKRAFAPALQHVAEAAVGVLAPLHVLGRSGRWFRWARTGRRSARPAGPSPRTRSRGCRRRARSRLIAPAALLVLRVDDQLDGLGQFLAAVRAAATCRSTRPGTWWRSRGRTSGPWLARRRTRDEAALLGVGQQIIDRPVELARRRGRGRACCRRAMKAMPHRPATATLPRDGPVPKVPSSFCREASQASPLSMARCAAGVTSDGRLSAGLGRGKGRRQEHHNDEGQPSPSPAGRGPG